MRSQALNRYSFDFYDMFLHGLSMKIVGEGILMYTEIPYLGSRTKGQLMLMYKNTLYKLERERAVLACMVKQYLSKGIKNLGEVQNLVSQNNVVDDIIVQEMYYRDLLNIIENREA